MLNRKAFDGLYEKSSKAYSKLQEFKKLKSLEEMVKKFKTLVLPKNF